MEVLGAALRIAVVSITSLLLSVLAMLTVKAIGINIKDFKQRTNPLFLGVAAVFNLLFIVVVALLLRFWDGASLAVLGFELHRSQLGFALLSPIISIGLALLYISGLQRKGIIAFHWNSIEWQSAGHVLKVLFGFLILFLAAFQEEIMFRGYFAFVLLPFGFYQALIPSGVLFTTWHFLTNKVNLFQTLDWLIGGLMLFLVYRLSGSIWTAAFVHFSRNLNNVVTFNFTGSNSLIFYDLPLPSHNKTLYQIIYSLVILGIAYGIFR